MNQNIKTMGRVESAPDTGIRPHGLSGPLNVTLRDNESVEWTWTHLPDGSRYVSGFVINKLGAKMPNVKLTALPDDQSKPPTT